MPLVTVTLEPLLFSSSVQRSVDEIFSKCISERSHRWCDVRPHSFLSTREGRAWPGSSLVSRHRSSDGSGGGPSVPPHSPPHVPPSPPTCVWLHPLQTLHVTRVAPWCSCEAEGRPSADVLGLVLEPASGLPAAAKGALQVRLQDLAMGR